MRIPRNLTDLAVDPANPRVLAAESATALRASLAHFGDIAGIVWNARTGQLVVGHLDVVVRRWQTFTGKQATLDGHMFAEVAETRRGVVDLDAHGQGL